MKRQTIFILLIGLCLLAGTNANAQSTTQYAHLTTQLDGGYYTISKSMLHFLYEEEYRAGNLEYAIHDHKTATVYSGVVDNPDSVSRDKKYGTNRISLDLSNSNLVEGRFYVLEVKSEKGDISKLRFQYSSK